MSKIKLKRESLPDKCPNCGAFIPMGRYFGTGHISFEVNKRGFLENWGDTIFEDVSIQAKCPNCDEIVSPDREIYFKDLEGER